jgi:hypothetical protein
MAHWDDDSWKDSYDEWKLRSPYDDEPELECERDNVDIDILDGRCRCVCGASWPATDADIRSQFDHEREYDEYAAREQRRERWLRLTHWFRWPLFRLLEKVWPRKALKVLGDDEIPF